jgi:hypothetical protein
MMRCLHAPPRVFGLTRMPKAFRNLSQLNSLAWPGLAFGFPPRIHLVRQRRSIYKFVVFMSFTGLWRLGHGIYILVEITRSELQNELRHIDPCSISMIPLLQTEHTTNGLAPNEVV